MSPRIKKLTNPTIKLEAARLVGYRTIAVAGIADPILIDRLEEVKSGVRETVDSMLRSTDVKRYELRFTTYGVDGVLMSSNSPRKSKPEEVGLLIEAIGDDQETADTALSLARSTFMHFGFTGRTATGGNLAFPFSPSDFRGGPVY